MKIREIDIPDNRPFIVRASQYKPSNDFNPPKTLGRPSGKTVEAKKVMAMDACIKNVLSGFRSELYNSGTPMFAGYGLLSSISQEALIRAGVETIADEMTRKFVKFRYDVDDGKNDHEQEISELEEQAAKYKIKDIFNDAAQKDGYFGGCLVYIDVGELDDEEAKEPLVLDKKTFRKGMLKGFKVIEPINIYPAEYNTTDPTDEHYFNPEYWYILGKRYHASRFLYFVSNSVPVLLKPAYNFFGIARAQLALDYIAHFVENRESAQELLNKFSLTCWKTDMTQVLAGESCQDLVKRVRMFNKMKSNNGTLVVDKEKEDIMQINTPLSGVRDIVDMSLSLLTAVWRIPKIKYIGEGEGGLNASSKEQMRSFYDFILSQKEKMFTEPMEKVLKILQLNMGKDINESIGFEFPSLVEMDDTEIANLNKLKADTAVQLINAGVVSQEEVRQNLSMDKHSGFSMIDVDDLPEEPEQPNEKEVVEVEDEDLVTDERWITVKPNGEEEKGRHLLLEGEGENQETPAEAMKRQWKVDITKKDDKKEERSGSGSEGKNEKTEQKLEKEGEKDEEWSKKIKSILDNADFGKIKKETVDKIKSSLSENFKEFDGVSDVLVNVGSIQAMSKKDQKEALEINKDQIEATIKSTEERYFKMYTESELIRSFGSVEAFKKKVRNTVEKRIKKSAATRAGRETAHFSWNTLYKKGALRFNENVINDGFFSLKQEMCEANGYHPKNCVGIKSTTDHEFGHAIERYILEKKPDSPAYKKLNELYNLLTKEQIGVTLSRYGATNFSEFIAEGYCEYRNNKPPREVAGLIGTLLKKAYMEAKNG